MAKFGYGLILVCGALGMLSMAMSWLWHWLDSRHPDPTEGDEPWSPEQWARHQNRTHLMRLLQAVGVFLMYASLCGALLGFALVGWEGYRGQG